MSQTAILFPGQGSLTAESADHARAVCPELVERAVELLNGADPFDAADASTAFAQPAIYLASIAGWIERAEDARNLCAMAGHSLGELSALAAARALTVEDALELVVLRGHLMASAADAAPPGGMVAVLGGEVEQVSSVAERHGFVVANDNAPGQLVLSGRRAGIDKLLADARGAGLRAIELDVAGAFHSPDMAPAEEPFLRALEKVPFATPAVTVISGYTARPFAAVRHELARAIVSPVRWRESMRALLGLGATSFVDVGPGRVLQRLVQRNAAPPQGSHAAA